jgi:phage terminase large subunit
MPYHRAPIAPVFSPLMLPGMRYRGAHGGRGGMKSFFFGEQLVEDSLAERGLLSVCIREVQKSLRDSSKRLVEECINGMGVADEFKVFKEVIETPGGGMIIFQGMQDHTSESIKSLQGFKRAWWDEAQKASATSLRLLRPTIREDGSELWFSWNPTEPPDPKNMHGSIDGLMRGPLPLPRAITVETLLWDNTYINDNHPLWEEEATDRARLPREEYLHVWAGHYLRRSEKRVFKNWKVDNFETPADAEFYFGADFGFAQDPSCLIRCWLGRWKDTGLKDVDGQPIMRAVADKTGRVLFIDREAWRVGCDVDHTPALWAGSCPYPKSDHRYWENPYGDPGIPGALTWHVTADSSDPKTISYMQRHGFDVGGAVKGPGSVEEGVNFLKTYDIVVHTTCENIADEFATYSFKVDRYSGRILPVLEDKKNHGIDAARYAVEEVSRSIGFFERY